MLDHRDAYLQSTTPTVMVPRFGQLEPIADNTHRFLIASDGLYLEVKRPWVHLRRKITDQRTVAMPYGAVSEVLSLVEFPVELVRRFLEDARQSLPNEAGGWLVMDTTTRQFRYEAFKPLFASPVHLKIHRPQLRAEECFVVDLHSHGHGQASFSPIDDNDDRFEVKISGILGNLDAEAPSACFRFCCLGLMLPFNVTVTNL